MNPQEEKGCKAILNKLSTDVLESICDTVTKRQVTASNRAEFIKAIVTFSESPEELLKRKKMSRELLFKYLVDEGIVLSVNSEKHTIISKILSYWKSENKKKVEVFKKEVNEQQKPRTHSKGASGVDTSDGDRINISVNVTGTHTNIDVTHTAGHSGSSTTVHVEAGQPSTSSAASSSSVSSSESDLTQKLGEDFSKWFFETLNSHNPTFSQTPQEFGPQHFLENSQLLLVSRTPEQMCESFSGAECIAQRYLAFVRDEQLLFCPNISKDGIFVKQDPHGLVVVLVCGTLHRGGSCLGVFEQVFGLLRDPRFENNWKIKMSKLNIRSSQVTAMPKLTEKGQNEIQALMAV